MNNVILSGILSAEPKLMYETYNIDPKQEINIKKFNEKCVVWLKLENNGQEHVIGARGHLAVEMANVINETMNVSIQGVLDKYIDESNKTVDYIRATGYTILEKEATHVNEINISGYISEPLNNRGEYSFCTLREDKYSSKIYCVHISNELAKNLKEEDRVELQGTYQERHLTLSNGDHVLDKFIQADTCKVLENLKETSTLGYIYNPYFENGELAGFIDENEEVTYYQTEDGLETYERFFYASGEVAEGLNDALHELTALGEGEGQYSPRMDRRLIKITGNQEYIKHKGRTESKLTVNSFEVMPEQIRMKKVAELGSAKIEACMNEYGYSSIKGNFTNWFVEKYKSSGRGDRTKEEAHLEQVLYEQCTAKIEQYTAQNEQKRNRFIGMDLRGKEFTQKDLRDINLEGAEDMEKERVKINGKKPKDRDFER